MTDASLVVADLHVEFSGFVCGLVGSRLVGDVIGLGRIGAGAATRAHGLAAAAAAAPSASAC